jgi:hypothetical protein
MAALARFARCYMAITGFNQRLSWLLIEWTGAFRYRDPGYCVRRLMALAEPPNPSYRPRNDYMHPWNWGPD